ncbi:hypothetical protein QUF76_04305 [Desulfobacterales bacterium HSG16]|nr:hypothetical protein [Desulfobacterales bacterium HSG16]
MTSEDVDLEARTWVNKHEKVEYLRKLSKEERRLELIEHKDDYIVFFALVIGFIRADQEKYFDIEWGHAFKKEFPEWSEKQQNFHLSNKFVKKLETLPEFPENLGLSVILRLILGRGYRGNVHGSIHRFEGYDIEKHPSDVPTPERKYEDKNSIPEFCNFLVKNIIHVLEKMVQNTHCPEMKTLWFSKTLKTRKRIFTKFTEEIENSLPPDFLEFNQISTDNRTPYPGKDQNNRSKRSKGGSIACLRFNAQSFKARDDIELSKNANEAAGILLSASSRNFPFRPIEKKFDKKSEIHRQGFIDLIRISFSGYSGINHEKLLLLYELYQCTSKGAKEILPQKLAEAVENSCGQYWKTNKK